MKKIDIPKSLFLASCGLALFLYGIVVDAYRVFPYQAINFLHDSVLQVYAEREMLSHTRPTEFLQPARHEGAGVTKWEDGKAEPGLTFVSGFFDGGNEMRLIRLDGTVVHRWPVRFSDFWPDPRHIRPDYNIPSTDWNTDIHGALALRDGSVVFNFEYGGMVKLDRCGSLVWAVDQMTHHSIEQSEDGGFWVPNAHYVAGKSEFLPLTTPYIEDRILKVSADGKVLSEISAPAMLSKGDLRALFLAHGYSHGDLIHLNDIEELTPEMAAAFPQFAAGDLLLSARELNLIAVVDPVAGIVKWHRLGPWIRQHDPDFQPDGTITVFNNDNRGRDAGLVFDGSTIMAVDPKSGEVEIRYGEAEGQGFYTRIRGKHQVLGNGNTLVTEFDAGRLFEITRSGDLVWEFINRFDDETVAEITTGIRYAENYFTVENWSCE